jgi:hypothetical protein
MKKVKFGGESGDPGGEVGMAEDLYPMKISAR